MKTIIFIICIMAFQTSTVNDIKKAINSKSSIVKKVISKKENGVIFAGYSIKGIYPQAFVAELESYHIILPKDVVIQNDSVFYKHYWFTPYNNKITKIDTVKTTIEEVEFFYYRTKGKIINEEGEWVKDTTMLFKDYEYAYIISAKEYKEKKLKK